MGTWEEAIKAKARELGYDGCGIIAAAPFQEFLAGVERRARLFPHAVPFYDKLEARVASQPQAVVPWARSIVVCLRRYDKYKLQPQLDQLVGKYYLFDGRLPYSPEYAAQADFEQFLTDSGFRIARERLPLRWAAVKAGLGKFRNNNFVYTAQGSWHWIDAWLVDKPLAYDQPGGDSRFSCPPNCNKCIQACPTGALTAPLTMDATRCIAHLTFSEWDALPPEDVRKSMGTYLYGCDECQNACPMNKAWQGKEEFVEPVALDSLLELETLLAMDEVTYRNVLQPRFWYIAQEDFWQWRCNIIRAMANKDSKAYAPYFTKALEDPDARVRQMAEWALNRNQPTG